MFKPVKTFLSLILLASSLTACTLPSGQPPAPSATPDYVLTITAQAALLQQPQGGQPPAEVLFTPTIAQQPLFTETPSATATITLSPTSSVTVLTVSADTNCRSGPSKDYDYLGALLANETAEVVGKNTPTNYWIIKNPDFPGTCWLWGNYVTVTGDISKLPEIPVPPTPTPSIPDTPKGLNANKICLFNGVTYNLSGFITWEDVSKEEGYRVYFNGGLFSTLPADTTTSALPNIVLAAGVPIKMSVEAYNTTGKSGQKSIDVICP